MHRHPLLHWTRGKQAPGFRVKTDVNPMFDFDLLAGHHIVLSFYGSIAFQKSREALQEVYTTLRTTFDDKQATFFGVCIDPRDRDRGVKDALPGIRILLDDDLQISKLYGAVLPDQEPITQGSLSFCPFSLVLDSRLRVYDCIPLKSAQQHTQQLKTSLETLEEEAAASRASMNAPVLIVPNVLPRRFCEQLIDIYRREGGEPSGTMTIRNGRTIGRMDRSSKRRSDYYINDRALIVEYRRYLIDHLFPQIRRAFHFSPDHVERYLVACYDGDDGGFFRKHRDNTTPGTAHRRFACTINLNAEQYSGGDLRFPEYGDTLYRAPTGGAVVFSASLLHEAMPVTAGKRYATLPFIHDAAAELIRQENASNVSSEFIQVDEPAPDTSAPLPSVTGV